MATGSPTSFVSASKCSAETRASPALGFALEERQRLARSLDLIVNSSGLTDFNPDLRDALKMNVRAISYLLDFLRSCDHAALLHLSTCYAVGQRDGRIVEDLPKDYTPIGLPRFRRGKGVARARKSGPRNRERGPTPPKLPRRFAANRRKSSTPRRTARRRPGKPNSERIAFAGFVRRSWMRA